MSKQTEPLTKRDLEVLEMIARSGTENSARGLTEMIGREVTISPPKLKMVPLKGIPNILGGPEAVVVGLYFSIEGAMTGHMMFALPIDRALTLVDMLMDEPAGTTENLGAMEISALGEAGNIMSSFFLTSMSNLTESVIMPSPPAVLVDMAGAILGSVLLELAMEKDEILVIETSFLESGHDVRGFFLFLASEEALQSVIGKVA